jgi:hypothetical protein
MVSNKNDTFEEDDERLNINLIIKDKTTKIFFKSF